MNRILLVLFSSLLRASFVWADSVDIDTMVVRDVRGGDLVSAQIHPGMPLRTFHLIADPEANIIAKIEIYVPDQKEPIQVLDAGQAEAPYRDSEYFKIVDINFDGYQDIGLLNWWGATGNEGWRFWRFDPESQKFVPDKVVSELGRPEFDPKTKLIRSFTKGGPCDSTSTFYTYQKGKLHEVKAERCNLNQEEPPQCKCYPLERL